MGWFKDFRMKLIGRVAQTTPDVVLDKLKDTVSPLEKAQKAIYKERVANYEKEVEKVGRVYTDKLNEYLSTYFNGFSAVKSENEFSYDVLNKAWREFVRKENGVQRLMNLKADSFEKEVAIIVSKNPQFKQD
jgi:hypothetical protein